MTVAELDMFLLMLVAVPRSLCHLFLTTGAVLAFYVSKSTVTIVGQLRELATAKGAKSWTASRNQRGRGIYTAAFYHFASCWCW